MTPKQHEQRGLGQFGFTITAAAVAAAEGGAGLPAGDAEQGRGVAVEASRASSSTRVGLASK